ncbi:unnamed protein product [Rotaria sp. Silwood1]|nr:unnamed protein product [Rotaria sp. Silwood1]
MKTSCCNGERTTVKYLLQNTLFQTVNRSESDENIHLHDDTVHLLPAQGTCRQILDRCDRTPTDTTKTEVERPPHRSIEALKQRFSNGVAEQCEWPLKNDLAESYSRAIYWGCVKDRGIEKTIKKILEANVLEDDGEVSTEVVKTYFKNALEYNDPTFLLTAYTVENQFYRKLNSEMTNGNHRQVFKNLCGNWTGYYTGIIMKNPVFDRFHFSGRLYRGIQISSSDYAKYKIGTAFTKTSFQSTTKSWELAKKIAGLSETISEKLPVMLIFTIIDRRSALSIEEISEFPHEEEVLIVPGTLFMVYSINENKTPYEIELRQLEWKNEF